MNNRTKDTLTAMLACLCILAGVIYWSSIFTPSALREIKIEQDKKMKEDQIVLQGCKNYKYHSVIYENGTPWRYIYTCEDGKQVATKLLWVK